MKVSNIRRKLIAALVAGGSLAPGALRAADLNTNIVVNGGFENVDTNVTSGGYGAVKILDWLDGTKVGFAYAHGTPNDFANGRPLAGGGQFYFTPAATPTWPNINGEVSQFIDLSDGVTGALMQIPSATFSYVLQADFSSYLDQGDWSEVNADFLNSAGAPIGGAQVKNQGDTTTWRHKMASGGLPAGTKTVRMSLVKGNPVINNSPDGYIDNVDLKLTATVPQIVLLVDRNSGIITLNNLTGSSKNISGYSITSSFGALKPASWTSIADTYDSGSPGMNQVDALHTWSELTKTNVRTDLSEADFQSGTGASLPNTRSVNLGSAWITTPVEDLVFKYVSNGVVVNGLVAYVGNGNSPLPLGDLNANGTITSSDWAIFKANQFIDMTGKSPAEAYKLGDLNRDFQNDHADFILFKEGFELTNGSGSFAAMIESIPEPSTALLVLAAGLFAVPTRRRSAGIH